MEQCRPWLRSECVCWQQKERLIDGESLWCHSKNTFNAQVDACQKIRRQIVEADAESMV